MRRVRNVLHRPRQEGQNFFSLGPQSRKEVKHGWDVRRRVRKQHQCSVRAAAYRVNGENSLNLRRPAPKNSNARQGVGPEVSGLGGRIRFDKRVTAPEKHFGGHPQATSRSENPRPMRIKVGSDVDTSLDLQIKHFTHEGSTTSAFSCSAQIRPCGLVRSPTASQKRLPR